MSLSRAPMRFLFDYVSPYAYLGWTQIRRIARAHGRELVVTPVLFAAMLNANDAKGPAEIPAKRAYLFRDVLRTARVLGVPLDAPPAHPFNPLLALRATSVDMEEPTRQRLVEALFAATWGGAGRGVTDPDEVARIATTVGLDGAEVVRRASEPAVKDRLRDTTAAVMAEGVFGVPTVLVDGELFWGVDAFGHLERFLAGEPPLDAAKLVRWDALPVGSSRR